MGKSQMIRFLSGEMAEFDIKKLIWKTVNFVFSHLGLSGIILLNPSFETKRLCEFENFIPYETFMYYFLRQRDHFQLL